MSGVEHVAAVAVIAAAAVIAVVIWTARDLLDRLMARFEFEDTTDEEEVTPCP